jgi:hypothetical protein
LCIPRPWATASNPPDLQGWENLNRWSEFLAESPRAQLY